MPYKDKARQRQAQRESGRRRRGSKLAEPSPVRVAPPWPDDPAGALAAWSRTRLKVPPGHPREGEPLELPAFAVDFLRDAMREGVREALLTCGRKAGKSTICAVLLLGCLAEDGPLRRPGFRAGVASVSREKAAELWAQMEDIALASGIENIFFRKVPRRAVSWWGSVDFLSADRTAGHSSGYDIALADEMGLYPAKGRDLVAGLLSSVSAKDGRMLSISVLGDSPLTAELVKRKDHPSVAVHVYQAPKGCALDDEAAWHAANPGLASGIKSLSYMRDMADRAAALPSEQSNFRAFDLNQPGAPGVDSIVSLDRWNVCAHQRKPERDGRCLVGFDIGGSVSMCAAVAYWPETGRLDAWGAFGDDPPLKVRGEADAVDDRYERMAERGELLTYPGRVTPVSAFLAWVAEDLQDADVEGAADRYRKAEAEDALQDAGVAWTMDWRAQGAGQQGSEDIRAFQRAVEGGTLRPGESKLLESAIAEAVLRFDGNGNPALHKGRSRGRIDALSAAVLAVGAGSRESRAFEMYHYRPAQPAYA